MRCDISGAVISRIERGAARSSTLGRLDRIVEVLGARMVVRVLWQGEELDRLLDRDHARIVNRVLEILEAAGWVALPEVTFQVAGERGSIDILGSAPTTGTVLVVEVKSVVPDIQALLAGIDRKARLAPRIASDHGWIAARVARLLVLPGDRTSRRRVDAFASTFERALPARTSGPTLAEGAERVDRRDPVPARFA